MKKIVKMTRIKKELLLLLLVILLSYCSDSQTMIERMKNEDTMERSFPDMSLR